MRSIRPRRRSLRPSAASEAATLLAARRVKYSSSSAVRAGSPLRSQIAALGLPTIAASFCVGVGS